MEEKKEVVSDEFIDAAQFSKKLAGSGISEEIVKKVNEIAANIKYVRNKDGKLETVKEGEEEKPEEKKGDEAPAEKPDEKPEEKKETKDAEKVDKRKLIDQIGGILKGKVDDEIIRTILKKAEEVAYSDSEKSADDEEAKEKPDEKEGEKKASDEEEKGKEDKEDKQAEDKAVMRRLLSEISKRDALATRLSSIIGDFEHSEMTVADVADYGVKHLKLNVQKGMEVAAIEGYLAGMDSAPAQVKFNSSTDRVDSGKDEGIINYLNK